ncbi:MULTISPECIES: hypothetical protein [Thermomonosporaceae]|uniref:hypothetical protein n=1 Tax=Thermomonosporaceae TaxID=2012 RepID=UPI00255AABD3|nr:MULTISPECIES: hypothetical protein [Thermomonosporaceae]MDL4773949.1 hypothetical protein [Actinomadura xylanilytica]
MGSERHTRLRRKYTSLGIGELVAAAVFVTIAVSGVLPVTNIAPSLWSALLPLLVILVQAGAYWLLARRWAGRAPMPGRMAATYRALRVLDPILLAAGLIGVIVWFPTGAGTVLVVAVWLFGVVEYLNYFVVRLSYPVHQWPSLVTQWRIPRLIKDLRQSE